MMSPPKNFESTSAAASADRSSTRISTQPTSIYADFLRAFSETVTSSCALASWMLWVVLFLLCSKSHGQVLDRKPQERYPCKIPISWENVTNSCQHVDGVEPFYSEDEKQRFVDLAAGQHVDFLLKPHEMIRVVGLVSECAANEEIELWLSDGSGLMRKLNVATTQDGKSVVASPDYPTWTVARLKRTPYAGDWKRLAIYTSRRSLNRGLDSYQCELLNCGSKFEIRDDSDKRPRTYRKIESGCRIQVANREVDSRVRFETRLEFNTDRNQHRSYWMKVYVNGALQRIVTFDTLPERYDRYFVNGSEQLLGRREFAYLDLAATDSVEVEFSHSCFLRVDGLGLKLCRPRENCDLLERLTQNGQAFEESGQAFGGYDPWLHHEQFLNIARDNTVRQGGLNAYMWMRAIGSHRHSDPDYREELTVPELAKKIRGKFTHFRDLLPSAEKLVQPRQVRFPVRTIRAPTRIHRQIIIGDQHVEEAASQLPAALLFPVSVHNQEIPGSLAYRVPENLGPSILRILVDKASISHDSEFALQYDNRPPILFNVGPETDIHSKLLKPGYQEAAILALANRHGPFDGSTLGGPFSSLNRNLDSTIVATHEVLLPAGIKKVSLRAISGAETPSFVGLQYLTSRYQKMSESEWFYHQQELISGDPVRVEFSKRLLKNQVFDMTSLFDSHLATFGASIKKPLATKQRGVHQLDLSAMINEAEKLKAEKNFVGLIEVLSDLIDASTGELKRAALIARADAMLEIGESFMGERELRGLMAFSEDPHTKKAAINRLLQRAKSQPFSNLLIEQYLIYNMFSADSVRDREELSIELAKQFAENGRQNMAFFAHPPRPNETPKGFHLRSLFNMRWFEILHNFSNHIPDSMSNLWNGLRSIQRGDAEIGLAHLFNAGTEGAAWINHWESAISINEQLRSPDLATRLEAIPSWEQWQATHPGPRIWEPSPDLVVRSRGAAHIYSAMRILRSQFFIASNRDPAVIEVVGPAKLRVEIRPIHKNDPDSRFDEWFTVTAGEKQGYITAFGNTPSQQLRIEGIDSFVPGRLTQTEISVPAGLHRIRLASREHRFLFRVLQDRPEIRLPALPVISPSTLAKVITGDYGAMMVVESGETEDDKDCVRVIDESCSCRSLFIGKLADPYDCFSLQQAWTWLTARNSNLANANRIRFMPNTLPFEQVEQDELHQQAAKIAFELAVQPVTPDLRLKTIALLQQICDIDKSREDLSSFLNYAKSGTSWQRFEPFDERAGIRSFQMQQWTPETPEVRVRRSLAGLNHATWVVSGKKEASIEVKDHRSVRMRLRIRRPSVGYIPMTETKAIIEIGEKRRVVSVDGGEFKEVEFVLSAGEHRIRIAHESAWANHLLHIEAFEISEDGSEIPFGATRGDEISRKRIWMVALPKEPIKFTVRGPGVYRIDRRVNERSQFEIIAVPEAEIKTFAIYPEGGREQEFVRIFELAVTDSAERIYSPKQDIPEEESPPSEAIVQAAWTEPVAEFQSNILDDFEDLALLPPDSMPPVITEQEFEELGWQELGTLAAHLAYRQRRALDELDNGNGVPGEFLELGVTRYFFDQWDETYTRSQFLLRPRLSGGRITLGLNYGESSTLRMTECEPLEPENGWGPIRIDWKTGLFAQPAGTPLVDGVSSFPWTVFANASVSRRQRINENLSRTPRLQFFSRYLSEEKSGFPNGVVDQDVFTRYKADHRYGFRLSDQWVYQCCIDRRIWMRPMLVTNPDEVIPDNLGVHLGVDQMLGPLQLRLGYRLTGFFADNDRSSAAVQNLFDFDAMFETWRNRYWRTEARLSIRHDVDNGTSFLLNLKSFFNQGRGYRDIPPDSMLFRSIKQERSLKHLMVQPPDAFVP